MSGETVAQIAVCLLRLVTGGGDSGLRGAGAGDVVRRFIELCSLVNYVGQLNAFGGKCMKIFPTFPTFLGWFRPWIKNINMEAKILS